MLLRAAATGQKNRRHQPRMRNRMHECVSIKQIHSVHVAGEDSASCMPLSPYFSNAGGMALHLQLTLIMNYYCIIRVKEHLYLAGRLHMHHILCMLQKVL
jgi:hypothetical protein